MKYTTTIFILLISLMFSANAQKKPMPVVFYLQHLPSERIGTLPDSVIIDSLRNQQFWVVPVDCSTFPASSPALEDRLVQFHKSAPALLATMATDQEEADLDNIYYVPEGHILRRAIPVWNIIEHGAEGSLARIIDTWNKEIVDRFGVAPVTHHDEMYDKHGNPIDYNMYIDLIYPSGTPAETVPLMINFSSNSPRQKPFNPTSANEIVYRNMFPFGFLTSGYAWANVDHCYNPLARTEVWTYFDRYSLEDWNGLALVTAYIRYINTHLGEYNLNGKIGTMGISKASYSSVRIANRNNAEGREHFLFGGLENTKPQPWPGVPSTIDVAYAAAGNGTRRVNTYVDQYTVPMATSAGSKDQYNQWDVYPEVVKRFNELDHNHLALWMEELGHTYPGLGTDLATGMNRYSLLKNYFDAYLKNVADTLQVFYMYPKENATEVDTDGMTRILTHDGILPSAMLGLTAYAPITVRFFSEVDSAEFAAHAKVFRIASQTEVPGSWNPRTGGTVFEFTPDTRLIKDEEYRIVVSAGMQNKSGQQLFANIERVFTVTHDGEDEVETATLSIHPTDDTYQKVSLGTVAYGSQNTMRVRYSPYGDWRFDGYLKFNIADLDVNSIHSAQVRLSSSTSLAGDPVSLSIFKTTTEWTEMNLLSANKPTIVGSALDVVNFTGQDLWTVFDVTNQLKADLTTGLDVVSFMIRAATGGSTENVYFNTKEAESETLWPTLVIEEKIKTTRHTDVGSGASAYRVYGRKLHSASHQLSSFIVMDVSGKIVMSDALHPFQWVALDVLPPGMYLIRIESPQGINTLKALI